MHYFKLAPRLKRIFASKQGVEDAHWHKLKREPSEKEMSHPADGEAWQDFDREYPDFAKDSRNLRLGLAADGFSPFGNFKSKLHPPYNNLSGGCKLVQQLVKCSI